MTTRIAINTILASDDIMVADGLSKVLTEDGDILVCGIFCDINQIQKNVNLISLDVIIVDHIVDGISGLAAARIILSSNPNKFQIILLTSTEERSTSSRALSVGIQGCITKQQSGTTLRQSVRAVANGGTFFRPKPDIITAREQAIKQVVNNNCYTQNDHLTN
jgi:DNA-binding NarL/FixJ family response regulator